MIWNLWRRALRRWAAYFKEHHAGVCSIREESTHNKTFVGFLLLLCDKRLWLSHIPWWNWWFWELQWLQEKYLMLGWTVLSNDTEQKERKKKSLNQHGAKHRLLDCYRLWHWVVHHLYDLNKQKRFILMLENVKLDETNLKSFCVIYSALLVLSHECGSTDMKNHEEALSKRS